jgi:acetyltransferase-like isoleucine patch superfamily enzyme
MKINQDINFSYVKYGVDCKFFEYCLIGFKNENNKNDILIIGNYAIVRSHTILYLGSNIGDNFSSGHHVLIREECNIADNVKIGSLSEISHHVKIGSNVNVHSQVFIPEYSVIESNAWIGPNVVLTNSKYPKSQNAKNNLFGCFVGMNSKIGANSTILPNVRIGSNALIGAGSVVTKDVPKNAVVAGNPAKIINYIENLPYKRIENESSSC